MDSKMIGAIVAAAAVGTIAVGYGLKKLFGKKKGTEDNHSDKGDTAKETKETGDKEKADSE